MDAFWTLARRMLRYRGTLVLAAIMAVISAAGLGVGLVALAPVIDAIVGQGRTLSELVADFNAQSPIDVPQGLIDILPDGEFTAVAVVMAVVGVLTIVGGVANFLHMYLSLTLVERVVAGVRRELFRVTLRMPLRTIVSRGTSDSVSRIINDPASLGAGMVALISRGVAQVSKGFAAFCAAMIIEWRLTAITLLVAPILATVIRKLGKRIRRASRSALAGQAGLYETATEAMQGVRVVRVSTGERRETGRFNARNREVLTQLLRVRTARSLSSPVVEVLTLIGFGMLALIAVKAIQDNELDPRDMFLTLASLGIAGASLRPLTGIVNDIQASSAAAQRVLELLQEPSEPGLDERKLGERRSGPLLPRLARHADSIRFDGVVFTYPNADEPALNGIELTVRHGETVAFVGPNGSGKTTLLALVARLFDPDEALDRPRGGGRVLIDGTDIKNVSVRSLRRQIAVVVQETVLFKGTIAENIAYGVPGVTHDQVVSAARGARAEEFIAAKGGYEAQVGERGLTLSGGQRQRLAIARAILRDPSILILDEATSMIDGESEAQISDALAEFSSGRTTLVVAHRLSTVVNADRIAVLDQGKLVDVGPHAELLERCDVYKRIADRQLVGS
ncbi:MAG: ABC transporter ATP-binding protein [Planctomycetota bacterium]